MYFAHSLRFPHPQSSWEPLGVHLRAVARLAKGLATALSLRLPDLPATAEAAGLLHDLGKYRAGFQEYIRAERGEWCGQTRHKQHKEAGAAKAWVAGNLPLAFAIAGHHGGMPDRCRLKDQIVAGPSGKAVAEEVWESALADCPDLGAAVLSPTKFASTIEYEFYARLLFSCLVDADWTVTGEFERRAYSYPGGASRPPELLAGARLECLLGFVARRASEVGDTDVARVRGQVLDACLAAAGRAPGVFTLTVPTGGGKTLSGLAFAMKHAAAHGLRRVIYVAPYLSVIDQNVSVIRSALGLGQSAPDLFEHHSLAVTGTPVAPEGESDGSAWAREAASRHSETWDAPIVATTNVQFFESLFSNEPGRCRKLHNIAGSVILLDECQAMPPGLVAPTCGMLKQLVEMAGCTVVLCTATQPAFDHDSLKGDRLAAVEIIPPDLDLFTPMRRVRIEWPVGGERWSWGDVAERMSRIHQTLCVVNTRKGSRALFDEVLVRDPEGAFHLSTAMCPAHRLAVMAGVRHRLRAGLPVRLVSTQLIEAGYDISFPVVFREMGPLEAIIQAGGRCNREGELPGDGGRVIVFRSELMEMPDGWYSSGWAKVEQALRLGRPPRIDVPQDIRDYYERLYNSGSLDERDLNGKRRGLQFRTTAADYKLIADAGEPVIVMTWPGREDEVANLVGRVQDRTKPRREAFRSLAHFQVNVLRPEYERLLAAGRIREIDADLKLFGWYGAYSREVGRVV